MSALQRQDLSVAARLAALVAGLIALTALAIHLMAAAGAREWLTLATPDPSDGLGVAADIFLNNVRLLGAVLVACLVVQIVRPDPDASRLERVAPLALAGICDVILLASCVFHIAYVGSALGGHGTRVLIELVPHGPVELASFTLALAVYVAARRESIAPRRFLAVAAASAAGLALAAVLEVYV